MIKLSMTKASAGNGWYGSTLGRSSKHTLTLKSVPSHGLEIVGLQKALRLARFATAMPATQVG